MSIVRPFACFVFLLTASGCGDGGGKANAPLTGAALGQQLFTQCGICHSPADPATAAGQIRLTGPNLWNVVGRPSASFDGYAYSPAMRKAGLVWDEQTLDRFLDTPQMVVRSHPLAAALQEAVVCRRRAAGNIPWNWNVGILSPPLPPKDAACE